VFGSLRVSLILACGFNGRAGMRMNAVTRQYQPAETPTQSRSIHSLPRASRELGDAAVACCSCALIETSPRERIANTRTISAAMIGDEDQNVLVRDVEVPQILDAGTVLVGVRNPRRPIEVNRES